MTHTLKYTLSSLFIQTLILSAAACAPSHKTETEAEEGAFYTSKYTNHFNHVLGISQE